MFLPLPTPKEMALWDKEAAHIGVPDLLLMENASMAAFNILQQAVDITKDTYILIMMGGGNNGGDAVCLARHLHDTGAKVLVIHTRSLTNYKGITGQFLRLAKHCGVPFMLASSWLAKQQKNPWHSADIFIDGLIGTGLTNELRPLEINLIEHINSLSGKSFTLALDIPSGLSGHTGLPSPVAINATATVAFEAAKPGLMLPEAAPYIGTLYIKKIGIPHLAQKNYPASYQMLAPHKPLPLPVPKPTIHKGTSGHTLIIGGSSSSQDGILTGAPLLAAVAAQKTGSGLVTIAAPHALCFHIKANNPDVIMLPLGEKNTCSWSQDFISYLSPVLSKYDSIVIGPGMGRSKDVSAFISELILLKNRPTVVLDADALYALSTTPSIFNSLRPEDILTPHPGEASLLLKTTPQDIQQDRLTSITRLNALCSSIWVLKGAGTLISVPGQPTTIIPYSAPNLAVGGSGDVLSGCIASFIAQGVPQPMAAYFAVQLHIEAGFLLSKTFPLRGNTASDINDMLPKAYEKLTFEGASSF